MLKRLFAAQILACLIFCTISVVAQTSPSLKQVEDSLKSIGKLIKESPSDSARLHLNSLFFITLNQAIHLPGSFDYPFDSIRILGKLKSPDKRFRMYNWNLPRSDGSNISFCILQVYNKSKDQYDYFDLADKSDSMDRPEIQTLDVRHWYGTLYYKIIENSSIPDNKKYYTLLGWIAKNRFIAEKIIEVLTFDEAGIPRLGAKIFKNFKDGQVRRVIFKYSLSAKMALNYNEMGLPAGNKSAALLRQSGIKGSRAKMIIFDHLIPLEPQLENQHQFYVPEADTYDAFVFSKDAWIFLQEVDARNSPNHSKKRK
jgi:hypothetical protein